MKPEIKNKAETTANVRKPVIKTAAVILAEAVENAIRFTENDLCYTVSQTQKDQLQDRLDYFKSALQSAWRVS